MIHLLPVGGYPPPTSSHYFERTDIQTGHHWLIATSNGSSAQWSSPQVHELPQSHFDNKQDGTLFSRVPIECAAAENKTRSTFC